MPTTVSVLIPACTAAPHLPAAMDSLRAQTYHTWELLVATDTARDDIAQLVQDFGAEMAQPVRCIELGPGSSPAAARNRLLELAGGDLVAFLDPGDLWQPAHLATLVNFLARGRLTLACSGIELWDAYTRRSLGSYCPAAALLSNPRRSLFIRSFIQTASCVVLPRSIALRTGRFDETLRSGEARDYWFRALDGGGTLGCSGTTTCRHAWLGSSAGEAPCVAEDTVRFHEKHAWAQDIPLRLRRRLLADARWQLARLLRRTDPTEARELGWRAWRATPLRPVLLGWCLVNSLSRRAK
jgi:glycosyltransferase involved in cell wall biosynthesis